MVKPVVPDLTVAAQAYLKLLYTAGEWSDAPVTVGLLADRLGLSRSTVSEGNAKLARQGLVTHAKYSSVSLTPNGRRYALVMVRRHRL
ncbi:MULTISPECIES: metal-dependent transcriptional regulator [Pseudarthrobacter]|uniref:metal-dependent transcriptional regulator n=1 Tax=Pseudarthrobacter TaxID=1742993 RepID=UPI00344C76D9